MYRFNATAYRKRVDWFCNARFGMFIHWGLYSIPGRGEWVRSDEEMPEEQYLPYFENFDPKDFDPAQTTDERRRSISDLSILVLEISCYTGSHHYNPRYPLHRSR